MKSDCFPVQLEHFLVGAKHRQSNTKKEIKHDTIHHSSTLLKKIKHSFKKKHSYKSLFQDKAVHDNNDNQSQ